MLSSKAKIILKGWSLSTGYGSGMHIEHYLSINRIFYFWCQPALLYGRLWLCVWDAQERKVGRGPLVAIN